MGVEALKSTPALALIGGTPVSLPSPRPKKPASNGEVDYLIDLPATPAGAPEDSHDAYIVVEGSEGDIDSDGLVTWTARPLSAGRITTSGPYRWPGAIPSIVLQQAVLYTVVGTGDGTYRITLNGVNHDFAAVGQTAEQIRDNLVIAVNGGVQDVTAVADSVSTTILWVFAKRPTLSFTTAVSSPGADMTQATNTANAVISPQHSGAR